MATKSGYQKILCIARDDLERSQIEQDLELNKPHECYCTITGPTKSVQLLVSIHLFELDVEMRSF